MPPRSVLTEAIWIAGVPDFWQLTFTPDITEPIGAIDPRDWLVTKAGTPTQPTSAELRPDLTIRLDHAVFDGTETAVRYLGPPPQLVNANGSFVNKFGPVTIPLP